MYIMVMADEPSKRLYDYFDPEQFKDVDLIISCGDLSPEYLTFFATCRFLLVVLVVRVVCPDVGLLHLTVSVILRC